MDVLTTRLKAELICFPDFVVFDSPLDCILYQFRLDALGTVYFFFLYAQCHNSVALSFILFQLVKK